MTNCLLLTSVDSEILFLTKQICEEKDIALTYAHSVVAFFERYYEIYPNVIIIDSCCEDFLIRSAFNATPSVFYNSIIISSDPEKLSEVFPKLKGLQIVKLEALYEAVDQRLELLEKVIEFSLDRYDGIKLNSKIVEELSRLKFKPNLKGYSTVKELVFCSCSNRYRSFTTMNQLYQVASRRLGISVACLERNLRTVINRAYFMENSVLREIFPDRSPTNKQLTNYICERMLIHAQNYHETTQNNISYYAKIMK